MNFINKTILISLLLISFSCNKESSIKMDNGLIIEETPNDIYIPTEGITILSWTNDNYKD